MSLVRSNSFRRLHPSRRCADGLPALICCFLGCFGCEQRTASDPAPAEPKPAVADAAQGKPRQKPLVDESVEIPGGAFFAGSTPGDPGRHPGLEPRRHEVELGPFEIDRLPYPNDPDRPPLTNVSRQRAERLCAERGARLCTELEWERACKGPPSHAFATGESWQPRCATAPNECASGFDVLGMGAALREWTASNVTPSGGRGERAAVRGAAASAPAEAHRCAQREPVAPDLEAADLGFRCCKGAPNASVIKAPESGPIYEKASLTAERLSALLAEDDRTRALARDVKFFREPDAAQTVLARGPGDTKGFNLTVSPLLWRPTPGAEYLIVSARSGNETSFVLAYHVVDKDRYRLASSFVMKNEPGPIALAYTPDIRPRLHFSSCWGCSGETGKILHRPPDSVALLQP